jgi:hypothetical protein
MKNDDNNTDKIDYLEKFINTKLTCGRNILELTTSGKNITMWWCIDTFFYNFLKSITTNKSGEIAFLRYLIPIYTYFGIYLEFLFDLSLMILLRLIRLLHRKELSNSLPRIIFISQDIEWKITRDQETRGLKKTDAFFDSISKYLSEWSFIGVFPINIYPIRGLRIYYDKLKNWNIQHLALNEFWTLDAYKKQRLALKHYKKQLEYIKDDEEFKKICIYNGQDIYQKVIDQINIYFNIIIPYQVKLMQMTHNMIKYQKPKIIIFQNEYGWIERPMLIAAQINKIPTIAIQHGIITLSHRGYIYKNRFDPLSPPIPDITAVYGRYYYDMLTNNSIYTKRNVVVTGQPRYDILNQISTMYSREGYFRELSIDLQTKVVLWATQCHGLSSEENVKNFDAVFGAVKELKHAILIIKQHPGEKEIHTRLIRHYLERHNLYAVITPKDSYTIEHIAACDLMITKNSTTAMEAVALNKPVIVLNLSEEEDIIDYVKEGIAIGVYSAQDLKTFIQNLLKDDSILAKNRQEFIEKHLYKIDGRSSERVADLIKDEITRTS